MAEPSDKAPELTNFLEGVFGRSTAIKLDRCVSPPLGCGGPAVKFRDELSRREYAISGLCQVCQDSIFGADPT